MAGSAMPGSPIPGSSVPGSSGATVGGFSGFSLFTSAFRVLKYVSRIFPHFSFQAVNSGGNVRRASMSNQVP